MDSPARGSWSDQVTQEAGDLEATLAAIQRRDPSGPIPLPTAPATPPRSARSNRRAALGLALVVILVGGVIQLLTSTPDGRGEPSTESRASVVFANAEAGSCISWPPGAPDRPSFVQCRDDHMFEVAKAVDITGFGEPCQAAVRQYLGPRYDPDGRFTASVLWAGDAAGAGSGDGKLLCGLQLLGVGGAAAPFKGQVADLDQSKVWPAGTCLGLDAGRSTDVPVECAAQHAVEVTGAVSLAERFPGGAPPIAEQDVFIQEACTRATEAYLAPVPLQATGVTLSYGTLSRASWSSGSRQVWCGVESRTEQGLQPLVGSLRGPVGEAVPPAVLPAAPPPEPEPSASADAVEAAAPAEPAEPVPSEPSAPESTTSDVTTTVTPSASPTSSAPSTPASTPPAPAPSESAAPAPAVGPPPGPAPETQSSDPPPGILRIPGIPDITLPGYVPPPPAEPAPPLPGPA